MGLDEGHPLAPIKRPTTDVMATWTGFALLVAGVSHYSWPVAEITAGVLLFLAGAMASARR